MNPSKKASSSRISPCLLDYLFHDDDVSQKEDDVKASASLHQGRHTAVSTHGGKEEFELHSNHTQATVSDVNETQTSLKTIPRSSGSKYVSCKQLNFDSDFRPNDNKNGINKEIPSTTLDTTFTTRVREEEKEIEDFHQIESETARENFTPVTTASRPSSDCDTIVGVGASEGNNLDGKSLLRDSNRPFHTPRHEILRKELSKTPFVGMNWTTTYSTMQQRKAPTSSPSNKITPHHHNPEERLPYQTTSTSHTVVVEKEVTRNTRKNSPATSVPEQRSLLFTEKTKLTNEEDNKMISPLAAYLFPCPDQEHNKGLFHVELKTAVESLSTLPKPRLTTAEHKSGDDYINHDRLNDEDGALRARTGADPCQYVEGQSQEKNRLTDTSMEIYSPIGVRRLHNKPEGKGVFSAAENRDEPKKETVINGATWTDGRKKKLSILIDSDYIVDVGLLGKHKKDKKSTENDDVVKLAGDDAETVLAASTTGMYIPPNAYQNNSAKDEVFIKSGLGTSANKESLGISSMKAVCYGCDEDEGLNISEVETGFFRQRNDTEAGDADHSEDENTKQSNASFSMYRVPTESDTFTRKPPAAHVCYSGKNSSKHEKVLVTVDESTPVTTSPGTPGRVVSIDRLSEGTPRILDRVSYQCSYSRVAKLEGMAAKCMEISAACDIGFAKKSYDLVDESFSDEKDCITSTAPNWSSSSLHDGAGRQWGSGTNSEAPSIFRRASNKMAVVEPFNNNNVNRKKSLHPSPHSVHFVEGTWIISPRKVVAGSSHLSCAVRHGRFQERTRCENASTVTWVCYSDNDMPSSPAELSFFNESDEEVSLLLETGKCNDGGKRCSFAVHPDVLTVKPKSCGKTSVYVSQWTGSGKFMSEIHVQIMDVSKIEDKCNSITLRAIVLDSPVVQVDRSIVKWINGGSSRLVHVRNGGHNVFELTAEVDSTSSKIQLSQNDGTKKEVGRFELVGAATAMIRPGQSAALWVRCRKETGVSRSAPLEEEADLNLLAKPIVAYPGMETETFFLEPRLFVVKLRAGCRCFSESMQKAPGVPRRISCTENRTCCIGRPCEPQYLERCARHSEHQRCESVDRGIDTMPCAELEEESSSERFQDLATTDDGNKIESFQIEPMISVFPFTEESQRRKNLYFEPLVVQFQARIRTCVSFQVKLCNSMRKDIVVKISKPLLPFAVLHKKIRLRASSYVGLPVIFAPVYCGEYEAVLCGNIDNGQQKCLLFLRGTAILA